MIVFLDLDGTLWQWHNIPDSARKAIIQAHENGHKIFVNTGRTNYEVPRANIEDLPFDGFCFSAGSEVIINNEKIIYDPLRKEHIDKLLEIIEPLNIGFSLEGSQKTFQNDINHEMFKKFAKEDRTGNGFIPHYRLQEIKNEDYAQIMKISVHADDGFDTSCFTDKIPEDLEFTFFGSLGGEITRKKYNKATAIKAVQEYYGTNDKTIAVGDSDNDIPMLKSADISIAMGNGTDYVKEISDYVTTDIDDNGLYNAFKHYNLI